MEEENPQASKIDNNKSAKNNSNPSTPDNMEQRITSMLEDVLKGDSSDEDLKKKMNTNPKKSSDNFKPMICLNDMPVSEDIYVIKDPNDFNFFGNNNNNNINGNIVNGKRQIKKNNTLDLRVNTNNCFLPKNMKNNNLAINTNNGVMQKQSQNLKLNPNSNLGNNNTLNFNGLGSFNLSPNMEKRKDKNLANYKSMGINATNLKENNLNAGSANTMNGFVVPGIVNKNNLNIPVNLIILIKINIIA